MSGMEEFKDLYLQTARERIQQLNDLLLKLEKQPEELELINELMRTGHSLKGESAAMGYTEIATLAHVIEDLFTGIGNGELVISTKLMDLLFSAIDKIQENVDSLTSSNAEISTQQIITEIKSLTGLTTEGFGKTDKSKSVAKNVAKSTAPIPTAAPAQETPTPTKTEQISTVTMKVEKLDQMISVSEELVLLKMKLKTNRLVQSDSNLKADIHRLDRLVTDLQFHIMQARLFPISLALHTLPRLARDTSKKTGKDVRLELEGEDTTVDRTIIDHLTEPFVHMIRNAIDHGIESPEQRRSLGKPEQAVVKIKAFTKENKFYVEVSDDGQGIDWQKVAEAAVNKGFAKAEEVKQWNSDQIEQLLYIGGVSTNAEVTDVSGRGVGMGAVQKAINNLGGSIEIKTTLGKGTTFILRLPMTLAIMQALLIKVGYQIYALPANDIVRSIQVNSSAILSSANEIATVVDDQRVAIIDLNNKFNHSTSANTPAVPVQQDTTRIVVLVKHEGNIVGCMVDKILAEEEILVKPLGSVLKQARYFSGATILANGSAAPIINVESLLWKPQN